MDSTGTEENISVSVRIRPLSSDEKNKGYGEIWRVNENSLVSAPEAAVRISHTFGRF